MTSNLTTIEQWWFNTLCEMVSFPNIEHYSMVLNHLNQVEFWVDGIILDENRIHDALDLRTEHCIDISRPVSVFEMIVALTIRCETSFLYDPKVGYRAGLWFEQILVSLGLDRYPNWFYDENAVNDILDTFLNRRYEPNGRGGMFTLKHPREDLTKVDIWMQAMWWFAEYENDLDYAEKYYGEEDNIV